MQNKWKQHLVLLICLCFIFISLFSVIYIAVEADHDCTEEHCFICVCIHSAEQIIKQLGTGIIASAFIVPLLIMILTALIFKLPVLLYATPVSQKIRMDN